MDALYFQIAVHECDRNGLEFDDDSKADIKSGTD
jgi:hypothetical protein